MTPQNNPAPRDNPNSSEYIRKRTSESEPLTEEDLAVLHDSLYGSLSPDQETSDDMQTVESYVEDQRPGTDIDVEEIEYLTETKPPFGRVVDPYEISENANNIQAHTNEKLKEQFALTEPDVGVTLAEAETIALGVGEEDEDSRKGERIALAKEFGEEMEQSDSRGKAELLTRFRNADAAEKIMQRMYELQERHGTIENATADELNNLGGMLESARTGDSEASEVVVTEEDDGTIHAEAAEEVRKREEDEALAAAKEVAQDTKSL